MLYLPGEVSECAISSVADLPAGRQVCLPAGRALVDPAPSEAYYFRNRCKRV